MPGALRRARGRPRDRGIDKRIVEATLEVVAERGIWGAAMDDIALRSGVSKATIYGRWPSKEALCLEAVRHAERVLPVHETQNPRADCVATLTDLLDADAPHRHVFARLLVEIPVNPQVAALVRVHLLQPQRDACARILARAIARGDLRADTDLALAVDMLVGPIFYRRMTGSPVPDADFPAQLVDAVWTAFDPNAMED